MCRCEQRSGHRVQMKTQNRFSSLPKFTRHIGIAGQSQGQSAKRFDFLKNVKNVKRKREAKMFECSPHPMSIARREKSRFLIENSVSSSQKQFSEREPFRGTRVQLERPTRTSRSWRWSRLARNFWVESPATRVSAAEFEHTLRKVLQFGSRTDLRHRFQTASKPFTSRWTNSPS